MSQPGTVKPVEYEPPPHGGQAASEHVQHAYQLLADGKWHPYNPVLVAVATRVHPAKAYRWWKRHRVTEPLDAEERAAMVRSGQRALARIALDRKARFEQRVTADGVRQIRLKPFVARTADDYTRSARKGWVTRPASARGPVGKPVDDRPDPAA